MDKEKIIENIYNYCSEQLKLTAKDLSEMPEQYEYGKIDGIHFVSKFILETIKNENTN